MISCGGHSAADKRSSLAAAAQSSALSTHTDKMREANEKGKEEAESAELLHLTVAGGWQESILASFVSSFGRNHCVCEENLLDTGYVISTRLGDMRDERMRIKD